MTTRQIAPLNWLTARNLAELGELTARWLEGTIATGPAYGGTLDEETRTIAPELAAVNRHGLVTLTSQPGRHIGSGCGQRAFVEGFADDASTQMIRQALLGTEIVLIVNPPAWSVTRGGILPQRPVDIAVKLHRGAALVSVGRYHTRTDIRYLYGTCGGCNRRAVASLGRAHQVTAIDPVWGRESYLWDALAVAGRDPSRR
ncbi:MULTISPECIES: DUF6919 domain-containing protein [Parafrankia]|uniref:DUF6919 domain-containing protein n=1 Tax=Parafrankia TaxID=2994362 RepID=UPI000AF2E19C|nr:MULTISPECIES: hypothetical protein [Parafrankia]MBE3201550.1 hypothetical protein [Parafrankia sp. CH37]